MSYWYVYNPGNRAPSKRHMAIDLAIAEAKRLAHLNPQQRFEVLAIDSAYYGNVSVDQVYPERIDAAPAEPEKVEPVRKFTVGDRVRLKCEHEWQYEVTGYKTEPTYSGKPEVLLRPTSERTPGCWDKEDNLELIPPPEPQWRAGDIVLHSNVGPVYLRSKSGSGCCWNGYRIYHNDEATMLDERYFSELLHRGPAL